MQPATQLTQTAMQPIIDINLSQPSVTKFALLTLFVALLVTIGLTAPVSLMGKAVFLGLVVLFVLSAALYPKPAWRLRFFESYWLVEAHASKPSTAARHAHAAHVADEAYEMTLTAMHSLLFCKQLVLSCDARKPLSVLVFRDQIEADTWRKLVVLANFKQFGNKFY